MQINSVRTKFLLMLLPLFIVSFIVFFGISYYMSSRALNRNADLIAQGVGENIALQVEKDQVEKEGRLDALAHDLDILHGDKAAKVRALAGAKSRSQGFAMLAYSDLNGQAVSDKGQDMDRASRDYIKAVKETKKPYITGPSVSGTNGKLIVIMALPVMDNGQLTGIVYGTMELDTLSEMAGSIKFMDTGYVYIADQEGLVLAYQQRPDDVGKLDLSKVESNKTIDKNLVEGFKAAAESEKAVFCDYRTSRGDDSLAVLTPIQLDGRRWIAVAAAPKSEVNADARALLWALLAAGLVIMALVIGFIAYFAKKLAEPIERLRDECEIINSGDLRSHEMAANSDDEIGHLAAGFKQMRGTIRGLLKGIQKNAEQLAASSEQLTAASQQSAEASNHAAGSIAEIAAGVEEQSRLSETASETTSQMAETAEMISQQADAIATVTNMTVDRVAEGRNSIGDVVTHMNKISEGSSTVQASISALAKSSDEISNIVEMISNIAGQTNLLALNAAIEAARAGEQGRGFAVVAEEVRKLAEESANSTQQIAELVAKIQQDMGKAVSASQEGTESVERGMGSVKEADAVFESILVSIQALAGGVSEVATSIQQMAEGTRTIDAKVENIREISLKNASGAESVSAATQQQSASIEEIASATKNLAELAEKLQAETTKFRLQ